MDKWSTLKNPIFIEQSDCDSEADVPDTSNVYLQLGSCFSGHSSAVDNPAHQDPTADQVLKHCFSMDSIVITPSWENLSCGTEVEESGPCGRFGHTGVLYRRQMIIFGGKGPGDRYLNDVLCFDLDEKQWTIYRDPCTPNTPWPSPRSTHAAVMVGDRKFVLGGECRPGNFLSDLWSFHVPTKSWRLECPSIPSYLLKGHTLHFLAASDTAGRSREDMLVVFGGQCQGSGPSNSVLLYFLTSKKWKTLTVHGDVPLPRSLHVAQLVQHTSLLIVFGGRTEVTAETGSTPEGKYLNDLLQLDISTGKWERLPSDGPQPSPRGCCASTCANGVFAVFCGGDPSRHCQDCFEYHISQQQWRSVHIQKQPLCSRPTVVYAKDQLVLFGGCKGSGCVLNCAYSLKLPPMSLRDTCAQWLWQTKIYQHSLVENFNHAKNPSHRKNSSVPPAPENSSVLSETLRLV